MPRPNPGRTIAAEQYLARRIKDERAARGWTLESVAARMKIEGCDIHSSAIYKIETANPPRRITVDELVAFSRVFDIPLDDLLSDPVLATQKHVASLLEHYRKLGSQVSELRRQQRQLTDEMHDVQAQVIAEAKDPAVKAAVEAVVAAWLPDDNPNKRRRSDLVEFFTDKGSLDHGFKKATPAKKTSPRKGTKA